VNTQEWFHVERLLADWDDLGAVEQMREDAAYWVETTRTLLAEVERLLEGYRYILGFDVAGYDGHLRNYEVAAKFIHYETGEALPDGSSISQIEEN
jgi:hypothetical protein